MQFTNGLPFTQVGFKGGASQNGIPVVAQGIAPYSKGGLLSTDNVTTSGGGFGAVLSVLPAEPNLFYYGLVTSGIVAGVLQFDASIAQNDPAHANYPLLGQPITVGYQGAYIYNGWGKTQAGAIDPRPGAVIQFKDTTGEIEFLASGASASSGWTVLTNCFVAQVDQNGFQGVTLQIKIPS
jgi:hypothetical protein